MTLPVPTLRIDATGTAFGAAPTWTDRTTSLRTAGDGEPVAITWGRQDYESEPQPRTCSFLLDNQTGAFTPGHAAAAAGWDVGARVNVRLTVGASTYDRFDGYVDSIEPTWPGGVQSWSVVKVSCTDVTARLAIGQPLRTMLIEEMLTDGAAALYPLDEAAGSVSAGSLVSGDPVGTFHDSKYGAGTATFGAETSLVEGATGLAFVSPDASTTAAIVYTARMTVLRIPNPIAYTAPWSVEFWTTTPTAPISPGGQEVLSNMAPEATGSAGSAFKFEWDINGKPWWYMRNVTVGASAVGTNAVTYDGKWHHIVGTLEADKRTIKLYVDGVLAASSTAAGDMSPLTPGSFVELGGTTQAMGGREPYTGSVTVLGFYTTALTAAQALAHYQSGVGALLERSDQRYTRLARYAGITASGLPTGQAMMAQQNLLGKNVTESLADVARTEGTISYTTGAGAPTFQARNTRYSPTSTLSLTADDISPDTTLRRDRQGFANEITITRDGGATQRVVDTTSQAAKGRFDGGSFTVMPSTDYDALQNASWQVAIRKTPKNRLPSVRVNLTEQSSTTTIGNVLAADISTQLTVTGLPSQAPSSTVSLFIEGATETISVREWSVEFFTSPSLPFTTLRADATASARTKLDNGLKIPF